MAIYKVEVRERAERPSFVAIYEIDALTRDSAIEVAMQRFRNEHPDKDIGNYSFERERR